ncbi:hypothetical protein EON68_03050, partial [archaeon]
LMALGFVDVSRSSIHHLLTHGTSVMIVVGGAQETLHARPGSADLVLKKRRGFVRLALEHGASLVPVYHFGENDLYGQFNNPVLRKMQDLAIKVLGFTIPVIRGRGMFQYDWGFLPRRLPLHTVMGTRHAPRATRRVPRLSHTAHPLLHCTSVCLPACERAHAHCLGCR